MPPLPVISGREAMHALQRAGWTVARRRGSHIVMTMPGRMATLSIPDHHELDRGTLRAIIRGAGMTVDQFIELL